MSLPLPQKVAQLSSTAVASGQLLPQAWSNLRAWADETWLPTWAQNSLGQLIDGQHWEELNNRFFKQNEFGTAGIRGRTIGTITPPAELGTPSPLGAPQYAAVGSATLNDFNILRATVGLYRYCQQQYPGVQLRLVVAHDVRHFSRHFALLTAGAWVQLGGQAHLFDAPRSTPELSFAVRHLQAHTGVVITASHNPAHDNGYKVYWRDGSQIVLQHDAGIIQQVNATPLSAVAPLLHAHTVPAHPLGAQADDDYLQALGSTLINPQVLRSHPPRIVYSPVHGTGRVIIPRALQAYGVQVATVSAQDDFDGRFPTVTSPNPQNQNALALALQRADELGYDIVMATDPDCDRMGAAIRGSDGHWIILSGNTTGALLAEDRLSALKSAGLLPPTGHPNARMIKTFVTTPLQDAIAQAHGVTCVNCLTGFKWIGHRLHQYEEKLHAALRAQGRTLSYDATDDATRRELLLQHSSWYVFGGEESYGYLGNDRVRDKDGNAAVLMFAEMAARLQSTDRTVAQALDALMLRYGAYAESPLTLTFEGAQGAAQIKKLTDSYAQRPPTALGDFVVRQVQDFSRQTIIDADGITVPPAAMIFCQLDDGTSFAIRPSGTEPTVKFYCFARESVREPADIAPALQRAQAKLLALKAALQADAHSRVSS